MFLQICIMGGNNKMDDNICADYIDSDRQYLKKSSILKTKKEKFMKKINGPGLSSADVSLSETNFNKASFFYQNNNFISAEKLLLENIELGTNDTKTFDMLINIYRKIDNYQKLIKTLDSAIKQFKSKKNQYRQLKKMVILSQILKDIKNF